MDWLVPQSIIFYEVELHVVSPELQYVLLAHPELLNPEWVRREKDIAALASLNEILVANGIAVADLRTMIRD